MKKVTGMSLILTEDCNLSCEYCYEKRKSPQFMTLSTAREAIALMMSTATDNDNLNIMWFGGEPTLNWTLMRDCQDLLNDRVDQVLITNCVEMPEGLHSFLENHPRIRIQLSWDGMKEFQDSSRGRFEDVVPNIKKYCTLPNRIYSHVQVTPTVAPKLFENISFIGETMGDKFIENSIVLRPIGEMDWDNDTLQALYEGAYKCYVTFGDKIDRIAKCEAICNGDNGGVCGAGKNFCTVTPSGDLYACHRFYFQNNRDFKVGTLSGGFIQDDAKLDLLEKYNKDNIIGCKECMSYEMCDRCIAANYGENFDVFLPGESSCNTHTAIFSAFKDFCIDYRPWLINPEMKPVSILPNTISTVSGVIESLNPLLQMMQIEINRLTSEVTNLREKVAFYAEKNSK